MQQDHVPTTATPFTELPTRGVWSSTLAWYRTGTAKAIDLILFFLALSGVFVSLWLIFMYVPDERTMGAIQRIFYIHVGAALACYVSFGIVFLSGIGYLSLKDLRLDVSNEAASEVGFLFCTVTLISGMIWAKTAWNTWFRWEPRLVTFLLLWFLFGALIFLRQFGGLRNQPAQLAVLGIMNASTVPLVWLSVKLAPQFQQLHPQVVEHGGLKDMRFILCFVITVAAMIILQFYLLWIRSKVGCIERLLSCEEKI